jgi:DNA-binding CsgD family transcriptional regulator/sugar-specific transcriptional regulator TrmB
VLEGLDLTPAECRCYEALVSVPRRTTSDLVAATALDAAAVQVALDGLVERGLVSADGAGDARAGDAGAGDAGAGDAGAGDAVRFVPAPPEVAVELLIQRQRELHERARLYAAELMDRYRAGGGPGDVDDHVELVHGRAAVAQRFQQLQQAATQEVLVFVKAPFLTPSAEQAETEAKVLRSGVRVRGLYERAAIEDPDDVGQVARLLADGEEARVVPTLPFKLAIADRRLALVPFAPELPIGDSAFLVHECGLLTALVNLAELLWDSGAPLTAPEAFDAAGRDPLLEPRDREVLQLLQAGLTDAAIARRLGTSERTIGRRVRRLMDGTGAETRFQLGWRAAERGWLRWSGMEQPTPG